MAQQPYTYGAHWVDRNGQSVRNKRRGPKTHHVFENEFPVSVTYEGAVYPSAFHAYQAARFADHARRAPLAAQREGGPRAMSVQEARVYGSSHDFALVPDFVKERERILADVVRSKFTTHERLSLALMRTGEAEMRYDSPSPTWGYAGGAGQNMHGRVLSRLRDELRALARSAWGAHGDESEDSPQAGGATLEPDAAELAWHEPCQEPRPQADFEGGEAPLRMAFGGQSAPASLSASCENAEPT
jgi:predicted NAD-dependent protein-ADP-ribosyltransferase YbiA (DUF1768 family)